MKSLLHATFLLWTFTISIALSDEAKIKTPSLELLLSFAGTDTTSKEFKDFLAKYDFGENTKEQDGSSYGSMCGVEITIDNERARIGICLPIDNQTLGTYSGELPKGLKVDDSITQIQKKLGKPNQTSGKIDQYYVMTFDQFETHIIKGKLARIWLYPMKPTKMENKSQ